MNFLFSLLLFLLILQFTVKVELAALAQMVECLPLVQWVRSSIPGEVVNFQLILNLGATLESASQALIKFQTLPQYVC